ncbi:MAG: hypothetical protein ACI9MJ_000694 [Alphaproteobacteria bacterium]|jgi:hypothetical protein
MSGQEMAVTDKPVFRFWLLICVLFVAACTVRLETAQLKSPDLTFTALDGSFKVGPGQLLRIPENTPYCYDNIFGSIGSIFKADTPIAAQPDIGKKEGGEFVRIDIAGEPKPLYGLLLFCSKPSRMAEYKSLSTHAGVTVPVKQRAIARSGRVASVQRAYKYQMDLIAGKMWFYSWVLWLADKPEKLSAPATVLAASLSSPPATAQNQAEIAYLAKYRTSEKFKAMHLDATKRAFKNLLPYQCKNVDVLEGGRSKISIIQTFIFNKETGEPEIGHWRETTKFVACGRRHLQHIEFMMVGPDDVRAVPMAPGDSIANHELQGNVIATLKHVATGIYQRAKSAKGIDDSVSCDSMNLIDTELLSKNLSNPPMKWQERWHIDQCGLVTATDIQFETTPGMGVSFKFDSSAR